MAFSAFVTVVETERAWVETSITVSILFSFFFFFLMNKKIHTGQLYGKKSYFFTTFSISLLPSLLSLSGALGVPVRHSLAVDYLSPLSSLNGLFSLISLVCFVGLVDRELQVSVQLVRGVSRWEIKMGSV